MLSKNVNNKKCAPKLIFFNEKKIEKDSDNFWHRKLTLKVKRLSDFALFDTSPLTQFSKFNSFLWVCWFLGKNLFNFVPPVWKLHNPYCHTAETGHRLVNCFVSQNAFTLGDKLRRSQFQEFNESKTCRRLHGSWSNESA